VLAAIPGLLAETRLGKPLTLPKPVTVAELMAKPVDSVGRTVQVTGRITEVCEKMGCWLNLVEPQSTKQVRFKVNDGQIVIPTQSVGKMAIAEGKLVKFDLTREQTIARARHEAEEQGRKFDANKIKAGSTVYQIQGDGVVIID
jgi:NACalpha-BTF3-like transcription factor